MESEPTKQVDAPVKKKRRWWPIALKAVLLIFVIWLFFRRTGCEQRDVRGTFQEFYGIFTAVEPADLELYRSLLPDVFDMPEQPGVGLFVVNYSQVNPWPMVPYLEGAVVLRASYKGEEGWHVITMPVTERVPCEGGKYLGFPKYVTDVSLWPSRGNWKGEVKHEGTALLTLEYTPGIQRELTPIEEEYLQKNLSRIDEPVFQLVPPGEGPKLNKIRSIHLVPPTWNDEVGMVRITIGESEPWAGLVAPGTESIGFLQKFNGGSTLVSR
jgi:acetoacetate decarboxylase